MTKTILTVFFLRQSVLWDDITSLQLAFGKKKTRDNRPSKLSAYRTRHAQTTLQRTVIVAVSDEYYTTYTTEQYI